MLYCSSGMLWLLNVYWFALGIGGLYILIAGALGAIGGAHGGNGDAGGHSLDSGGHDFDSGHSLDSGGHDIDSGHDFDSGGADGADDSGAHGALVAAHQPDSATGGGDISPFNWLNLMACLAGFGGTGLALLQTGLAPLASFPIALGTGVVLATLFHLLVVKFLLPLQATRAPSQDDMLGLDAEVLTPLEPGHLGEIAYILDGQRFTSPAKLIHGERAGRKDAVTIVKVEGSTAHVELRRRLLD
jgi:membrane protein implicated in regulation of membrane protease activity